MMERNRGAVQVELEQKREEKITPLLYAYIPYAQKLVHIYAVMYPTGMQRSKRHIKGSAVKNALLPIVRKGRTKKNS